MGVSGVAVALLASADGVDGVDGVSVAVGASVAVATRVSVSVSIGAAVSVGDCALQAENINTRNIKTTNNFFLIRISFLFETAEEDNFIIYKN
jgi:hypothetical protein